MNQYTKTMNEVWLVGWLNYYAKIMLLSYETSKIVLTVLRSRSFELLLLLL